MARLTALRRRRVLIPALLAILAAVGLAVALPWAVRAYARRSVQITLIEIGPGEEPGLLGRVVGAARTAGALAAGGTIHARVRLRSTALVPVVVLGARYRVWSSGRDLGEGSWTPRSGAQRFEPGQWVEIVAPLDTRSAGTRGASLDLLRRKDVELRVRGEMRVAFLSGSLPLPLEVPRIER